MSRALRQILAAGCLIAAFIAWAGQSYGQPKGDAANPAAAAKAAFDKSFGDYKDVIRTIEKLRVEYQSADAARRVRINNELSGHVAHAQTLMNTMIDSATEAYRLAPNSDPQVAELLISVVRHFVVGQQVGQPEPRGAADAFTPIDGGEQYEKALPIIRRLIDGGANKSELYVWGFLAAFLTNDYDLAAQYFNKAQETKALADLSTQVSNDRSGREGALETALRSVTEYSSMLDKYRQLWAKESQIRAAEAAADNLPRVKLTTTKGEITLELFENEAPQSVANFLTLVKQGFYKDGPFHRVLPKFMAQGGAKTDDGQGGPGHTIRGEHKLPNARMHFRGSLSMARKGGLPDSGSSQFFLTFVPTSHLDGEHAVFGRVIEGIEVLGDLQRRSPQHQANPPNADRIIKAEVLRDRGHEYKFERLPGD